MLALWTYYYYYIYASVKKQPGSLPLPLRAPLCFLPLVCIFWVSQSQSVVWSAGNRTPIYEEDDEEEDGHALLNGGDDVKRLISYWYDLILVVLPRTHTFATLGMRNGLSFIRSNLSLSSFPVLYYFFSYPNLMHCRLTLCC